MGKNPAIDVALSAPHGPPRARPPRRPASPPRSDWVIGRTTDLTCLIGGALVAYGLLAAHVFLGVAAVTIYMVWVLAIDGPHVFATVSRTYLDRDERVARAGLLRGSLGFFALGPATVGLSALAGRRLPYDLFLTLCTLWAYWHVVRQHYGVMVLYKKKAGDTEPSTIASTASSSTSACSRPSPPSRSKTSARCRWSASTRRRRGPRSRRSTAWSLCTGAFLALAVRQVARVRTDQPIHWTKLLFLMAATSVSAVLFSPPVAARVQYEAIVPIVTSFHNVQYLAIVWFFHRNRLAARRGRRSSDHSVPLFVRQCGSFSAWA